MTIYSDLISRATGITEPAKVDMIESYMRHIYFHSTLDWQTTEQLEQAARESALEVAADGWRFQ